MTRPWLAPYLSACCLPIGPTAFDSSFQSNLLIPAWALLPTCKSLYSLCCLGDTWWLNFLNFLLFAVRVWSSLMVRPTVSLVGGMQEGVAGGGAWGWRSPGPGLCPLLLRPAPVDDHVNPTSLVKRSGAAEDRAWALRCQWCSSAWDWGDKPELKWLLGLWVGVAGGAGYGI